MTMATFDLDGLVRRGWLAAQAEDFRHCIAQHGRLRTLESGEPIAFEGDTDKQFYGIVSGAVSCLRSHRHEAPILATVLFPGQWFGTSPHLTRLPRVLTFTAKEHSVLLCLDPAALDRMRARFPDLSDRLGQLAQMQANYLVDIMSELLIPQTELRIAAVLLRLTGWTDCGHSLPLNQTELAEMANASRASVAKVVKELKAGGLLATNYARIEIRDPDALADWFQSRLAHA